MERAEAVTKIQNLVGKDLRALADKFGIRVWKGDHVNKGWAGHTVERYLGLPLNSSQCPNFGSWELKVVPLKRNSKNELRVKETMAITMIDDFNVKATKFEDSHLYAKLQKIVIVAREFENRKETRSFVRSVGIFDLDNPKTYATVKADYNLVRKTLVSDGFEALTGKMGNLVQPRTKGAGHGSTSRAFYARTQFVAHILGLEPI